MAGISAMLNFTKGNTMERFRALIEYMPFIMATGQTVHLSIARVVEAIIIAAIVGGITVYSTTKTLEVKMDAISERVATYIQDGKEWRHHVQNEIDTTQKYLYTHGHNNRPNE